MQDELRSYRVLIRFLFWTGSLMHVRTQFCPYQTNDSHNMPETGQRQLDTPETRRRLSAKQLMHRSRRGFQIITSAAQNLCLLSTAIESMPQRADSIAQERINANANVG